MNVKVILLIVVGVLFAFFMFCAGCVWWMISSVSSGYEVTDGRVYFRSFDNLTMKVKRKEVKIAVDTANLRTIRGSGGLYATDGTSVLYEGSHITEADPETFQVLDWRGPYSRDAKNAFWGTFAFSDDPDNLELLGASYSRDSQNVYSGGKAIEGADPGSFVLDNVVTSHAHDKNYRYNMGRRVEE